MNRWNFKEEEIDSGDELGLSKSWLGKLKASSPEIDDKTFNKRKNILKSI